MSTDDTTWERRAALSGDARAAAGMIRRMALTLTSEVTWQVTGHELLDGKPETRQAEVFSGIGFFSRPRPGSNAEAILGFVGGSSNPVVVATRDEDTRKRMATIQQDETVVFNSVARVLVKRNATVEISSGAGNVEPTLLGASYISREGTVMAALSAAFVALNAYAVAIKAVADPSNAATSLLTGAMTLVENAIATFNGSLGSNLSLVIKVQ